MKPFDLLLLSIVKHLSLKLMLVIKEINGLCEASRTLFKLNSIKPENRKSNHNQLEQELHSQTDMLRQALSWNTQ